MSELYTACLRAAVNLAREEQIHSLRALHARLARAGFTDQEITAAVRTWAQYEQQKVLC